MVGEVDAGVGVEELGGGVAGELHDGAVGGEVGDAQVEGDAALEGAFEVAGAAHAEVGFGDEEAVGGGGHELEALAGIAGDLGARHEDAVAAVGSTPYPAAELMEL